MTLLVKTMTTFYLRHKAHGDLPTGDFLFLCRTNAGASILVPGNVQQPCEAKDTQGQKGGSRSLEEVSPATYSTLPFFPEHQGWESVLYR